MYEYYLKCLIESKDGNSVELWVGYKDDKRLIFIIRFISFVLWGGEVGSIYEYD